MNNTEDVIPPHTYDHREVRCDVMADADCDTKLVGESATCCVCAGHDCAEAREERAKHPKPAAPAMSNTERMAAALQEIRKMAMEHSCFDADCFERRDIDGLCLQGGDICGWTMVAIHADDGLRALD